MQSPDLQRIKHIRDYCLAIGETIRRYGDSRQATADRVQWGPMKAMRNLVAHNYGKMDQAIIWETATVDIPALLRFCNEQLKNAAQS